MTNDLVDFQASPNGMGFRMRHPRWLHVLRNFFFFFISDTVYYFRTPLLPFSKSNPSVVPCNQLPTRMADSELTSKDYYFDSYAHFGEYLLLAFIGELPIAISSFNPPSHSHHVAPEGIHEVSSHLQYSWRFCSRGGSAPNVNGGAPHSRKCSRTGCGQLRTAMPFTIIVTCSRARSYWT